jgi:membrane protease YdiL (CAAX protease family)
VNWKHVGVFYGVALGGAIVVSLLIWALRGVPEPVGPLLGLITTAVLYMPLPLVAGLVTERVARRRPLIAHEWRALRTKFFRTFGQNALVAVLLVLAIVAMGFLVAWLAGTTGLPGAGHLVVSDADLRERMMQISPAVTAATPIPPIWVLIAATGVQGVVAGLTINTLFAFGEEYGWRGVLADELRPLGLVRATALTGVLWGLWHAPIIVLGHNYGAEWGWGIPMMVTWTVPLAFLLTWTRERTGSVLAPSMLHGLYNAMIGIFTLLIVGGGVLVALPVGILAGVMLTIIALVVWRLPKRPAPVAPVEPRPEAAEAA